MVEIVFHIVSSVISFQYLILKFTSTLRKLGSYFIDAFLNRLLRESLWPARIKNISINLSFFLHTPRDQKEERL